MRRFICVLAVVAIVLGIGGYASANFITNPNFNYTLNGDGTAPYNGPDQLGDPSPAGSTFHGNGNWYDPTVTLNGTATLPGWTTSGTHYVGVYHFTSSHLATNPLPGTTANVSRYGSDYLEQTVTGAFQPNTTYTLSFDMYARSDQVFTGYAPARLLWYDGAGNGLVALTGNTFVWGGAVTWTPWTANTQHGTVTMTYTSGATVASNDFLIKVMKQSPTADPNALYTNFSLTAIPEPGTLALLGTGLIGLLCYAWRKRK